MWGCGLAQRMRIGPKPFPAVFRRDVIAVARKGETAMTQIAPDFGIFRVDRLAVLASRRHRL
jgi:hypothetical protein